MAARPSGSSVSRTGRHRHDRGHDFPLAAGPRFLVGAGGALASVVAAGLGFAVAFGFRGRLGLRGGLGLRGRLGLGRGGRGSGLRRGGRLGGGRGLDGGLGCARRRRLGDGLDRGLCGGLRRRRLRFDGGLGRRCSPRLRLGRGLRAAPSAWLGPSAWLRPSAWPRPSVRARLWPSPGSSSSASTVEVGASSADVSPAARAAAAACRRAAFARFDHVGSGGVGVGSSASSGTGTIGWGGAPRPSGSRWATASNRRIDPATAALSEPTAPRIGIRMKRSARRRTVGPRPWPSLPTTITSGPRRSLCRAVSGAFASAPATRRP